MRHLQTAVLQGQCGFSRNYLAYLAQLHLGAPEGAGAAARANILGVGLADIVVGLADGLTTGVLKRAAGFEILAGLAGLAALALTFLDCFLPPIIRQ